MFLALTRRIPVSISRCELTHLERVSIDYARAVEQHAAYEDALRRAGCRVQRLPDAPDFPDSVFVEDTAVVFDDLAVMARPGAESRRGEVDAMAAALRPHRRLAFIEEPGTLDGGDVLVTPGRVFVGISGRTNLEGANQLASHIAPIGFDVIPLPVEGCLHLKSAVTVILPATAGSHLDPGSRLNLGSHLHPGSHLDSASPTASEARVPRSLPSAERSESPLPPARRRAKRESLLINPAWVDSAHFPDFELIDVDPSEPAAANVLAVNGYVICAEEHPRTRARLEVRGFTVLSVPAGELAKAEGGVTCCSVILTER